MPFFPRARKSGRRREDDGVQAISFDLDRIDFVQASDDIGLLRIAGRWTAPVSRALGDMLLSVRREGESLMLSPLPDMIGAAPVASPAGEEWRGAFTMTVDLADDPRTEFAIHAGDEARVTLPRPSEWAALQADAGEPAADHGSESPVVAELVARLDEVARLEEDAEPVAVAVAPEVAELRAQLAALQAELEVERRRREALVLELRQHASVEEDLRNAIAMQEAEMASAVAQATRAREAERRRDLAPGRDEDHGERSRPRPADEEFIARLDRARRASEAAPG